MRRILCGLVLSLTLTACAIAPRALQTTPVGSFAADIAAFTTADAASPPARCPIVFVGSSSVRRWTSLTQDFAPLPVLNRGFGGSQISDINDNFDLVVTRYHPSAIVFYAGENDLNAGESPASVIADFERFMALTTERLGSTPVYFISLKPSRLREAQIPAQAQVNAAIRDLAQRRYDLVYIDVVPPMLDNGRPRDLFVADGLHMRPEGYAIWTGIVRPVVEAPRPTRAPGC